MQRGQLVKPELVEHDATNGEGPSIAHIGRPGWHTAPDGPTALCGARLVGIKVEAGFNYPFICRDCREQLALLEAQTDEQSRSKGGYPVSLPHHEDGGETVLWFAESCSFIEFSCVRVSERLIRVRNGGRTLTDEQVAIMDSPRYFQTKEWLTRTDVHRF